MKIFPVSPTPVRKIHVNIGGYHIPALHQEVSWEQSYGCSNSKSLLMYKNSCEELRVSTISD